MTSIKEAVRKRYAELAGQTNTSCCGPDLYGSEDLTDLDAAAGASLGCGNPIALASLTEGQVVLDLGSGGGLDVFLAARRVGSAGKVYGLDMTDEMLELARSNQAEAGVENVEFLKGELEEIPLPDGSVDVIISNCVINLSPDKPLALAEAFRVLAPGGMLAVTDIVLLDELPEAVAADVAAWTGCVAGALEANDYLRLLLKAGFEDPGVEVTGRVDAPGAEGAVVGASIRARKPA
jgi:SAM-dependent methyltransferase